MNKYLFLALLATLGCVPLPQSSGIQTNNEKTIQLSDATYEPQIKTVRLFPAGMDSRSQLRPAVTQLGNWNLTLEFDDLQNQKESYYARIIHCNRDWSKSSLQDLDFMPEYNEYPINTFTFSLDTHYPYVHYSFRLPAVKLPGNYVLMVYRGTDRNDLILTKRFMVYDQKVTFLREGSLIGPGTVASVKQQLNFTINYKNLSVINPMENINVSIRQNQRWDVYEQNIKPSFLRDNIYELEYRFFDPSKMFKGGNEFRFFDLRSLNYPGRNVDKVDKTKKPFHVFIQPDKTRNGLPYAIYDDLNGNYSNDNYDYRNASSGSYASVYFILQSPTQIQGDVYLNGAFTNWNPSSDYKMTYDSISKRYVGMAFLKQGWYDYEYMVKSATLPSDYFEGSHFETENQYEIFVYYRSFQPLADLLVGYVTLNENPR